MRGTPALSIPRPTWRDPQAARTRVVPGPGFGRQNTVVPYQIEPLQGGQFPQQFMGDDPTGAGPAASLDDESRPQGFRRSLSSQIDDPHSVCAARRPLPNNQRLLLLRYTTRCFLST